MGGGAGNGGHRRTRISGGFTPPSAGRGGGLFTGLLVPETRIYRNPLLLVLAVRGRRLPQDMAGQPLYRPRARSAPSSCEI